MTNMHFTYLFVINIMILTKRKIFFKNLLLKECKKERRDIMNILIVNPPNKPFTNETILAEPLDVLQIATVVKKRFKKVQVIDMDVERMENNINEYLSDKNVVVFVYDYQLPLHTSDAINNIFEIIKNLNRETKVIMIGKTSTYSYSNFLEHGVDVVIKGIAEELINDVIEYVDDKEKLNEIPNIVYKDNDKVIITKQVFMPNNYNKLPMIDRDFVDISKYMETRTIITSRGCIGGCKFCTTPYYFRKWVGKSASEVVNEIEMLINKYNAKQIMFLDDNATVDKKRMMRICKLIRRKKIKCLFGALCSIKCYDYELLKEMYSVGFRWVHFGLESGSSKILKMMNKEMDIERVKEIINEVKEMGYRVRTSFILDYPGTTVADLKKTRKLLKEIRPHELRLHYLAYRYGTPVYDENTGVVNKTQYIHGNKPNIENKDLEHEIELLLKDLKKMGYEIITDNTDWMKYNKKSKDTKVAAFVPIKYGMCWYE